MVEFHILGSASEVVGKRRYDVYPEQPTPIKELLEGGNLKEDNYIVMVDGQAGSLQTPVWGDDRVVIMPIVSGG